MKNTQIVTLFVLLLAAGAVICAPEETDVELEQEQEQEQEAVEELLDAVKDEAGETEPQIVGGEPAELGQFPFAVFINIGGTGLCGGSIIAQRWIMTAAHCVTSTNPATYKVVAGALNRKEDTDNTFQEVSVVRVIKHEKYNAQSNENDIALMKVNRAFQFNEFVGQIALPGAAFVTPATATVAGWGTLSSGGDLPDVLQFVNLKIVSHKTCDAAYRKENIPINDKLMICAGDQGKDSCQGDSGGALFTPASDGTKVAIGVVSFGIGCAKEGFPGVYTRVQAFTSWIEGKVNAGRRQV